MTMLRSLLAQRSYVALSVLTLALSVGANVVVFTIVNALWLRPRPVTEPDRVVVISNVNQAGLQFDALRLSDLDELRRSGVFSGVAGQATALGTMGFSKPHFEIGDGQGAVETLAVTADYFEVLGIGVRGRAFTDADDDRAAPTTVIISDRLWRERFDGGDVIGQTVPTSYEPTTIIGIAPPGFHGARLGELADAWIPAETAVRFTPLVRFPGGMDALRSSFQAYVAFGRLTPGESVESAARQLDAADPDLLVFPLSGVMAAPGLLTTEIREGRLLGVVGATAALVLIAGCATLAALVMVHYERRRREFAVRLALGAGRTRLAQRLGSELGVIAILGMTAAFGLASATMDAVRTLSLPVGLTLDRLDLVIDWRVVLGGVSGTVITLAAAGLLPVSRFTRPATVGQLTSTATAPPSSLRLRRLLLATHAASTIVVLVGAALFVRTVAYGFGSGAGFDVERTVFVTLQPAITQFPSAIADPGGEDAARRQAAFEELLLALVALPGVESAASGAAPLSTTAGNWEPRTVATDAGERSLVFGSRTVGDDYLDVLGIPLLAGSFAAGPAPDIDTADGSGASAVVVTKSMAEVLWPDTIPLGRTFAVGNRRYSVTGVVDDFVQGSVKTGMRAGYVMPRSGTRLGGQIGVVQVALRSRGLAEQIVPAVRRLADARFPEAAQLEIMTGTALLERDMGRERLGAAFFSGYGVVSLVLGFAGVFGIVAYLAESRRKEFGIRAALGATRRHLTRHAIGTGLVPVAAGTAVGLIAAVLMSQLVDSFLFGVSRLDPVSFAGSASLMLAGATAAGVTAAWRIRGLSPMDALRE